MSKKICIATAEELCAEDTELLRCCTDVALSMDERKMSRVLRMRLVLGSKWPQGFQPVGKEDGAAGESAAREIMGAHGKYIITVDRLLDLQRCKADDTVVELADGLIEALKKVSSYFSRCTTACGTLQVP